MSDIKRKINSDLDDRMTLDWQGTTPTSKNPGWAL